MRAPTILAVSASVAALAAAPMFSKTNPAPSDATAPAPTTLKWPAFGTSGGEGPGWIGRAGGSPLLAASGTSPLGGGEMLPSLTQAAAGLSGTGSPEVAPASTALVFVTDAGAGGALGGVSGDAAGTANGADASGTGAGLLGGAGAGAGGVVQEAAFAPVVVGGPGLTSVASPVLGGGGGTLGNSPLIRGGGTVSGPGDRPLMLLDFRPGESGPLNRPQTPNTLPEPAGLALLGSSLLGLALVRHLRRRGR